MPLLRFGYRRLSTAYALGPGLLDAQWHDMKDTDVEEMLKDEECWYGTSCTGVNLNGMNHTVYNLRGMGLCMASRASYNTALCYFFFSMNLFRCLDFADLKDFLYHVRHVHMIQRIQIAWKSGAACGNMFRNVVERCLEADTVEKPEYLGEQEIAIALRLQKFIEQDIVKKLEHIAGAL